MPALLRVESWTRSRGATVPRGASSYQPLDARGGRREGVGAGAGVMTGAGAATAAGAGLEAGAGAEVDVDV